MIDEILILTFFSMVSSQSGNNDDHGIDLSICNFSSTANEW